MAHGRKRLFLVGLLCGGLLATIAFVLALGLLGFAGFSGPVDGRAQSEALDATREWARLAPLPSSARDLRITKQGSSFTRTYVLEFTADPAELSAWLTRCSGLADPKCQRTREAESVIYEFPGGGGALIGRIEHDETAGQIRVHAIWS